MSLVSYNPANQLTDDVLLVIFDHLDEEDILRCEVVCRQWQNFLQSGTPWRRLFHRKHVSSEKWCQVWREFGLEERNMQIGHYREVCKAIIQEMNELDNNWRTGNYKIIKKKCTLRNSSHFVIGKDFLADFCNDSWSGQWGITFRSRATMDVQHYVRIPR
jgi:F-box-like